MDEGWASHWARRAARSRQAHPEEAQELSWGPAKGQHFLTVPDAPVPVKLQFCGATSAPLVNLPVQRATWSGLGHT